MNTVDRALEKLPLMAEFAPDFNSLVDTTMDLTAQFPSLNPKFLDSSMSFQSFFCVSDDLFYAHQPTQNLEILDAVFPKSSQIPQPALSGGNEFHEKRKRCAIDELETSSAISTPQVSENGIKRKKSSGRVRKVKNIDREEEKSGEIVHVRARRGQATDSHSLAERVRRGKINERLRCLQDIVPGCYKSMGMTVMLDEIINYVQSLQNQVEFLSMKLAAASSFNEFSLETMAKAHEAKEWERLIREGCFQSTWPF